MSLPTKINPLGVDRDFQPLPPHGYERLDEGVDFVITSPNAYNTYSPEGTAFDTGLILSAGMRLRMEMQPHATRNYARQPFGTQTNEQNAFLALMPDYLSWGYLDKSRIPYTYGDKLLFEAFFNGENVEMTANGQSASDPFVPQNEGAIWLGCTNRTTTSWYNYGRPTPMRFWRLEYWKHDRKIADIIPVKNPATGDLQIWDSRRKLFLSKIYGEIQEPDD